MPKLIVPALTAMVFYPVTITVAKWMNRVNGWMLDKIKF